MVSKRENSGIPQSDKGPTTESIPTTSTEPGIVINRVKSKSRSGVENCFKYIYNKEDKTICERTCTGWIMIVGYSISFFILLSAYTMLFLFGGLYLIKITGNVPHKGSARISDLYQYAKNGVGLSVTPTSVNEYALIWYRSNQENDYEKYLLAIDKLIKGRNTSELIKSLGPCGLYPYGYGDKPCAIVRINKELNWSGIPLTPNSTVTQLAPKEVQDWVKASKSMLWLHCDGYNMYDREHIGRINYHPYPPGFDPKVFPLDIDGLSPLVAVQFSEYRSGVSVDVLCKLWYDQGPSFAHFTLFIDPQIINYE